jgi:hypothetical protein
VEAGQNDLDPGYFFAGVLVDRHASAIVPNFDGAVGVQGNVNFRTVASDSLVNAVIDDFLNEMIRPAGIGIHARPLSHRV